MVGIGITPEGIETNYVVYDLMLEMGWRSDAVGTQTWLKDYTTRRYAAENSEVNSAWEVRRHMVLPKAYCYFYTFLYKNFRHFAQVFTMTSTEQARIAELHWL